MNPMMEYIHSDDSHHQNQFGQFKDKHGKTYDTQLEHNERLHIFRQNLRYIDSINRKGLSYRVAINHLADKSDDELKAIRGKAKTDTTQSNNGLPFDMGKYKRKDLPDTYVLFEFFKFYMISSIYL
jgi:formyltetrahydrofolate synthetase